MKRIEISSAELPTLSELLTEVERGEDVVLTRDGRDIATLSSAPGDTRVWPPYYDASGVAQRALDELFALGDKVTARGLHLTDGQLRAERDDIGS